MFIVPNAIMRASVIKVYVILNEIELLVLIGIIICEYF